MKFELIVKISCFDTKLNVKIENKISIWENVEISWFFREIFSVNQNIVLHDIC